MHKFNKHIYEKLMEQKLGWKWDFQGYSPFRPKTKVTHRILGLDPHLA